MDRVRAAVAGLAGAALLAGAVVLVRVLTRFVAAVVWLAETAALAALALVVGYVVYRVLWGASDDPRRH